MACGDSYHRFPYPKPESEIIAELEKEVERLNEWLDLARIDTERQLSGVLSFLKMNGQYWSDRQCEVDWLENHVKTLARPQPKQEPTK
jgi:hypothetical protein